MPQPRAAAKAAKPKPERKVKRVIETHVSLPVTKARNGHGQSLANSGVKVKEIKLKKAGSTVTLEVGSQDYAGRSYQIDVSEKALIEAVVMLTRKITVDEKDGTVTANGGASS